MEKQQVLQKFVRDIVEGIVDEPDAVEVQASNNAGCIMLSVRTAREDIGKVIGRTGRTARSLRIILSAVATKHKTRFELDIWDGEYEQ